VSRVIAVFNQAGGVGKTTITMNLGYQLATRGHRVLLVDMDPQSSLTTFMGVEPDDLEETIYDAIVNETPIPLLEDLHQMRLAPANIGLSAAEIQLVNLDFREIRLREALAPVLSSCDFVLIDCPPSLGLLSYISLIAATHVLVPVETHFKAFKGTDLLLETVGRVRKRGNKNLKIVGFVPSRYASVNSQDKRTLEAIQQQFAIAAPVFEPIPRVTAFVDATEQQMPLAVYSPKHPVLEIFDHLAQQMEQLT
jgi:chromosome partitioning protein